jgi:hypothetical protein
MMKEGKEERTREVAIEAREIYYIGTRLGKALQ